MLPLSRSRQYAPNTPRDSQTTTAAGRPFEDASSSFSIIDTKRAITFLKLMAERKIRKEKPKINMSLVFFWGSKMTPLPSATEHQTGAGSYQELCDRGASSGACDQTERRSVTRNKLLSASRTFDAQISFVSDPGQSSDQPNIIMRAMTIRRME